jgi:hypothetical protein
MDADMAAPAAHADPAASNDDDEGGQTSLVLQSRLQELKTCALRAELDARNIQQNR